MLFFFQKTFRIFYKAFLRKAKPSLKRNKALAGLMLAGMEFFLSNHRLKFL